MERIPLDCIDMFSSVCEMFFFIDWVYLVYSRWAWLDLNRFIMSALLVIHFMNSTDIDRWLGLFFMVANFSIQNNRNLCIKWNPPIGSRFREILITACNECVRYSWRWHHYSRSEFHWITNIRKVGLPQTVPVTLTIWSKVQVLLLLQTHRRHNEQPTIAAILSVQGEFRNDYCFHLIFLFEVKKGL